MNLALLAPSDFISENQACIHGRRLAHIYSVLKAKSGDSIRVGRENGPIGTGKIVKATPDELLLDIQWQHYSPPPLPATLIIALPRPKMLKRILQTAATMGVKNIYFINAYKVEKSFWQSPWLSDEKIQENLILGLEQGIDTIMPTVHLKKLFKPFVEDELPNIIKNTQAYVAHPGDAAPCPQNLQCATTLAIGPEGGFTPYEVNKLIETGFQQIQLGPRILRVETAVPAILAKMF